MTSPTTVVIDKELLAEAKEVLGARTTREAIDRALRDAVRRERQRRAMHEIAALDLDPDATKIHVEP